MSDKPRNKNQILKIAEQAASAAEAAKSHRHTPRRRQQQQGAGQQPKQQQQGDAFAFVGTKPERKPRPEIIDL